MFINKHNIGYISVLYDFVGGEVRGGGSNLFTVWLVAPLNELPLYPLYP